MLNVLFWSSDEFTSEASVVYEKCISLHKIAFLAFFVNCKDENGFQKQFVLCSNLFSKLEKSCFKKPFPFCSPQKKAEKQFFGVEYIFL